MSSSVQVVDSARDLGVVIDNHLTMVDHVTAVSRIPRCLLLSAATIRLITVDAAKTLVQSFITCHLDYCNALFSGITDSLFRRLLSVQNAAARLVTGTRRRDHITPVLRQLHWLPVRQRVDFKLALLVYNYKALHDATALLQHILQTTASLSLTPAVAGSDRPTSIRATFHGPTHGSAIGASQPLDHGSGTVCQPGFASPTTTSENFDSS